MKSFLVVTAIKTDSLSVVSLICGHMESQDCVVIATDHSVFDYEFIVEHSKLVVDFRNATKWVVKGREKIVKA